MPLLPTLPPSLRKTPSSSNIMTTTTLDSVQTYMPSSLQPSPTEPSTDSSPDTDINNSIYDDDEPCSSELSTSETPTTTLLTVQQSIHYILKQYSTHYTSSPSSSPLYIYQFNEHQPENNSLQRLFKRRSNIVQTSIPDFWLTVLLSHPAFSFLITCADTKILNYCNDININIISKSSFEIIFSFQEGNPYLRNTSLIKKYTMTDTTGRVVHPTCSINWISDQVHSDDISSFGLIHWLTYDQYDSNHFGELIRDEIFPNAIDIYFGAYNSIIANSDTPEHIAVLKNLH